MLEGQKVIPKRVTELGFQYRYPNIEDACKQLVQWILCKKIYLLYKSIEIYDYYNVII